MDRVSTFAPNPAIGNFLNNGKDPWNHFNLVSKAPMVVKPRAVEENVWLPFWISGASRLAFHEILPLNPLQPHIQNNHMPQFPFLQSGTSMPATDKSHVLETIPSSQHLAALTNSSDTETFVSANSVIGEVALDPHPFCLVEGENDGPMVVPGGQMYGDPAGKDGGKLGVANLYSSLNELLEAWVT